MSLIEREKLRGAVLDLGAGNSRILDLIAAAPAVSSLTVERLTEALREIDGLRPGHLRRNGFATPDPWVRQREVRRIVARALAPPEGAASPDKGEPH